MVYFFVLRIIVGSIGISFDITHFCSVCLLVGIIICFIVFIILILLLSATSAIFHVDYPLHATIKLHKSNVGLTVLWLYPFDRT
jgi:hypothetical protein